MIIYMEEDENNKIKIAQRYMDWKVTFNPKL